jgi:Flp pilus assembly pilin Flp
MSRIRQFLNDSTAVTSVEYAVMLSLILMAVFGAVTTVGQRTASSLSNTTSKLQAVGFGQ